MLFDRLYPILSKATQASPGLARILPYLFLLVWTLPLIVAQTTHQSLMAHDEGYYAVQARYMVETGDWITPQWGLGFSFDRTVGIQWLIGLCYRLFGMHETSVRLPSAIAYILSTFLTFRIGEILLGRSMGFLGALIFGVMPITVQYAWLGTQDSALVAVELLAAWSLLEAQISRQKSLLFLTGAAFGWAFLLKGFMAIPAAIAFFPALLWQSSTVSRSPNASAYPSFAIQNLWLYLGGAIGLLPVAGWLYAAVQQYGCLPLETLVGKLFMLGESAFHSAGPFYYWWNVPANAFPWGITGLLGLGLALWNPKYRALLAPYRWLAIGFPLILWIELNVFKTKTPYYPLQLLPWLAILSAITLDHCVAHYRRDWRSQLLGNLSSILAAFASLLLVASFGILFKWIPVQGENIDLIALALAILGLSWWMPSLVWRQRDRVLRSELITRWLLGLLLGPWLALGFVGWSGLWGDYGRVIANQVNSPIVRSILDNHPVRFVATNQLGESELQKAYLNLTFHTAKLGPSAKTLNEVAPFEYAWIAPDVQPAPSDRKIITIQGWRLIQRSPLTSMASPSLD